jgi:DNA-binding GntR family transcriptional regulator
MVQTDFEFHETLCWASGNQRLVNIWLSMSVQIRARFRQRPRYFKPQEIVRATAAWCGHARQMPTECGLHGYP